MKWTSCTDVNDENVGTQIYMFQTLKENFDTIGYELWMG